MKRNLQPEKKLIPPKQMFAIDAGTTLPIKSKVINITWFMTNITKIAK